jgi:hypothetical protein
MRGFKGILSRDFRPSEFFIKQFGARMNVLSRGTVLCAFRMASDVDRKQDPVQISGNKSKSLEIWILNAVNSDVAPAPTLLQSKTKCYKRTDKPSAMIKIYLCRTMWNSRADGAGAA